MRAERLSGAELEPEDVLAAGSREGLALHLGPRAEVPGDL